MKALVLCAGRGTRLAPLTDTTPKVMLPLDGKPLLGHTLEWLAHHDVRDVAINLHHAPNEITDYVGDGSEWGLRVRYSNEETLLGTAGALHPLKGWIGDDEFVGVYGDKFLQADLTALIAAHRRSAARMTVAVHHTDRPRGAGLVEPSDYDSGRGVALAYEEKPDEPFSQWANAGLYVCEPWVLDHLPDAPCDWGRDYLPWLVKQCAVVYCEPIHGLAMDIGTPERYAQAQALAAQPGAIFLDRDGTINECAPGRHVKRIIDFRFLPGALEALAFLAKNSGRKIAIWTNQPAVGSGEVTPTAVGHIHTHMTRQVEDAGGRVNGVYVCPHAHGTGCDCRKPAPGLLLRAAQEMGANLAKSVVVGDTQFDLRAAWAAGVRECYMVLTGGMPNKVFPHEGGGHRYEIVVSLLDAARLIVKRERDA
jgi:histidinol-phosphate phosphatase family protein